MADKSIMEEMLPMKISNWESIEYNNNAERRGDINWDSKAAAFCFGQDFLIHYSSEDMVVIGNKFDKKK